MKNVVQTNPQTGSRVETPVLFRLSRAVVHQLAELVKVVRLLLERLSLRTSGFMVKVTEVLGDVQP